LAFNSGGDLFEADSGSGNIYEFTTNGTQSTFATGLGAPHSLAFQVPVPEPSLSLIKALTLQDYSLNVGSNYQVQVSADLINWTNQGAVFTATSAYWQATNYWLVANWNQLFFRLVQQ
jgi:hypothetical protein